MARNALVRNTQAGPTVFSYDDREHIEWQGAGDPMGGDVQPVPEKYFDDVRFVQNVNRGIFEVEAADQEIQRVLSLHRQEWETRQARQKDAASRLDSTPQNDVLMAECIGPAANGQGTCGTAVPLTARNKNEKAPLCGMHSSLASQYIAIETDKIVDGKPEVKWAKTQISAQTYQD